MKKFTVRIGLILVIAIILSACGSTATIPASASLNLASLETSEESRLVTVTGDAEVRVTPDEVIITLGVETDDRDLTEAKRQNDVIVDEVIDLAQAMGIDTKHVQTDFIDMEPMYDYSGSGGRRLEGYKVRKTIVVRLTEVSQFEAFLSGALQRGVNHVHNVEFRTTELREYRDQARALAIQAAKEKAEALAGELGQNIGEPVLIQEERNDWKSWYGFGWGRNGGGQFQNVIMDMSSGTVALGSGIAPGQITITAQVSVSFKLR